MQKWVTVPGFFAAFCLYLWLWVNPALLSVDPALLPDDAGLVPIPGFSWSPLFLKGFLVYPGGPAECVWLLIAQSYYYPWAGALVITAVAALLGVATHSLMAALAGGSVPIVRFLPAILMVALYSRYADKLPMLVGLLLAMLAVYAYVRTGRRGPAFRLAAFLALSAAVYHVAGGAYLLYAALCGVFELRRRQGRLLGVCYLLLGGIVPYAVGVWLWDRSLTHAYAYLSPFSPGAYTEPRIILLCVYLAILLPALGCAVWPWLAAATKRRGVGAILQRLGHLKAGSGLELAVVLVAAAVVVVLSFDSGERSLRQIDWFAAERMWPQVLREAQGLPRDRYTFTAIHAVNRALYETGRLPYEMFAYPQHPLGNMVGVCMSGWPDEFFHEPRRKMFFQLGDIELQLGLVNEAEHEAYEALEIFLDHPLILKRIALIHIVKGQPDVARVFLRALSGYIRHGAWARDALRRLEADPLWSTDPEVEHIRSVRVARQSAILDLTLDQRVDELLRTNRRNRMAFEYRMAHRLVTCHFGKFISELRHLDDLDYPDIPRHYEEAILVYEDMKGEKVELHGREISAEARQAFREFRTGLASLGTARDKAAIWNALAERFGDTYFFYNAQVAVREAPG